MSETENENMFLTPDEMLEHLRALVARIPDVPALTPNERKLAKKAKNNLPMAELRASLAIAQVSDRVTQALGASPETAEQWLNDAQEWGPVERELLGVTKAVADANLIRRQRASIVALQAYAIGRQLVRDPEHAALIPHVLEVKRLKALRRRKVTVSGGDDTPSAEPPSAEP